MINFSLHVDVQDHQSAKDILLFLSISMMISKEERQLFLTTNLTVKPKTGTVLVFPPTWQYPHIGKPVKWGPKYIMSTYLHYQ